METKPPTTNPQKTPIILLVLGLALILIAQTMDSKKIDYREEHYVDNTTKKIVQYGGIGLLVIGGIMYANGMNKKKAD